MELSIQRLTAQQCENRASHQSINWRKGNITDEAGYKSSIGSISSLALDLLNALGQVFCSLSVFNY